MNAARFTKRARLLSASQFDVAFKQGRRITVGQFTTVIAANPLTHARLGFALSKKHAARAVDRNRARRLLRERFRLSQAQLVPVDLVIMLRGKLPAEPQAVTAAVDALWQQVMSRCKSS